MNLILRVDYLDAMWYGGVLSAYLNLLSIGRSEMHLPGIKRLNSFLPILNFPTARNLDAGNAQ